jgi:hypothetical protein
MALAIRDRSVASIVSFPQRDHGKSDKLKFTNQLPGLQLKIAVEIKN